MLEVLAEIGEILGVLLFDMGGQIACIVITELMLVISELMLVISELMLVISELMLVISELMLVLVGFN